MGREARICVGMAWLFAILLFGCTAVAPKMHSVAFDAPEKTRLGRDYASAQEAHPGESGVFLLETGFDALAARTALIDRAEKTIDLQYFIVRDDATSRFLFHKLRRAADRGVRIRLLLDDIHKPGDAVLRSFGRHPSIELRIFNRFRSRGPLSILWPLEFLVDLDRLNRRMHNKVFIVDNQAAIVGGRNLGDEYFEAAPEMDFHDLDVLAVGGVVRRTSRGFDQYWNSEWAEPVNMHRDTEAAHSERQRLGDSPFASRLESSAVSRHIARGTLPLVWARTTLLHDPPSKIDDRPLPSDAAIDLPPAIIDLGEAVRKELLIISAYFVPGHAGTAFLKQLRRSGVRVGVLTNSLATTDVVAVHGGYARYRTPLVQAGVVVHELKPTAAPARKRRGYGVFSSPSQASLHAKAMVFDRRRTYVGSLNIDPRSVWLNTETGFIIDSEPFAAQVARWYERATAPASSYRVDCQRTDGQCTDPPSLVWTTAEKGRAITFRDEPAASIGRRISSDLWYLLGLDHQL